MIGQPKFWYGGMLQQAAAGRFLGYGGMRQPGVDDFTYRFTPCGGVVRGRERGPPLPSWTLTERRHGRVTHYPYAITQLTSQQVPAPGEKPSGSAAPSVL